MIPFTMRCLTCGNHMYKGKKFNARKEIVEGEKYLGMPIFQFYIRCPVCLSEIAFKVFISLVMTVINYSLSLSLPLPLRQILKTLTMLLRLEPIGHFKQRI